MTGAGGAARQRRSEVRGLDGQPDACGSSAKPGPKGLIRSGVTCRWPLIIGRSILLRVFGSPGPDADALYCKSSDNG